MEKVFQILKNNLSVLFIIFSVMFFRTAIADWNHVPSGSMEPTLYDGDWLVVNKIEYGPSLPFLNKRLFDSANPKRGDIITFIPPHTDVLYVKRVIGVPGDNVGFSGKNIFINGEKLSTTHVSVQNSEGIYLEKLKSTTHSIKYSESGHLPSITGTFTVPEGSYFVLGDHRNNSADSRVWGLVDGNNIMGKVTHVAFSTSDERTEERFAIQL